MLERTWHQCEGDVLQRSIASILDPKRYDFAQHRLELSCGTSHPIRVALAGVPLHWKRRTSCPSTQAISAADSSNSPFLAPLRYLCKTVCSAAGLPTGHSRHTEQRHKRTAGKPRIICSLQVSCPTGPADMRVARRCYHCSVSRPGNPHNSAAGGLSQTAGWKFQRYPENEDKGRTLAGWPSASLAVILRLGSSLYRNNIEFCMRTGRCSSQESRLSLICYQGHCHNGSLCGRRRCW